MLFNPILPEDLLGLSLKLIRRIPKYFQNLGLSASPSVGHEGIQNLAGLITCSYLALEYYGVRRMNNTGHIP